MGEKPAETDDVKQAVQQRFGQVAASYATSAVHARGADLDRMVALVLARSTATAE